MQPTAGKNIMIYVSSKRVLDIIATQKKTNCTTLAAIESNIVLIMKQPEGK